MISGLKIMWLIVMFDLPTETKEDRKKYTKFRKFILNDGFTMMQFSVYKRHCFNWDNSVVHINRIKNALPESGEIRILSMTDKQFGRMEIFYGPRPGKIEKAPEQLLLF